MSSATQALLMTAGLFGLSFFAIFAIWYAERLRVGTPRKLQFDGIDRHSRVLLDAGVGHGGNPPSPPGYALTGGERTAD